MKFKYYKKSLKPADRQKLSRRNFHINFGKTWQKKVQITADCN